MKLGRLTEPDKIIFKMSRSKIYLSMYEINVYEPCVEVGPDPLLPCHEYLLPVYYFQCT